MEKKDGALFGPPKPDYHLPTSERKSKSTAFGSGEFKYTDKLRATVPSKDDRPIMGITTTKNFVTANAVEAILQGTYIIIMFVAYILHDMMLLLCYTVLISHHKWYTYRS